MDRRKFLKGAGAVLGGTGIVVGAYRVGNPLSNGGPGIEGIDPENAYFLSPDGDDDSPGTEAQPLATLEAAVDTVEPGEAIVLRGGRYERDEQIEVEGVDGTSDQPITVMGYPGERPIFDFDGPTSDGRDADGGIRFHHVSNMRIRNLVVQNSPYFGILVVGDSTNNVFEDITTHRNNLSGFAMHDGPSKNVVRRIVSASNHDPQNDGNNADGVQFARAHENTIEDAQFFYNSDDGLDLWGSHDIEIRRCLSWNNGRNEEGNGIGFKLGGDDESGGHRVVRCVAFNNRYIGFSYNGATAPMALYNNTSWSNPHNFSFYSPDHEIANNIAYDGEIGISSDVDDRYNTWNQDIDDPEFVSQYHNHDQFLHLSEGSPCINAGTDVGIEYRGDVPDLGAYEFARDSGGTPIPKQVTRTGLVDLSDALTR